MSDYEGHGNPLQRYSDAARRMSDAISLELSIDPDHAYGKYMAFKLRNGETDRVLYDTRTDAVRHQRSMDPMCYVQIHPGGMLPQHCERFLAAHRQMYDDGYRIPHPEDVVEIELPKRREEWKPSGLILPKPRPNNQRLWRPST